MNNEYINPYESTNFFNVFCESRTFLVERTSLCCRRRRQKMKGSPFCLLEWQKHYLSISNLCLGPVFLPIHFFLLLFILNNLKPPPSLWINSKYNLPRSFIYVSNDLMFTSLTTSICVTLRGQGHPTSKMSANPLTRRGHWTGSGKRHGICIAYRTTN